MSVKVDRDSWGIAHIQAESVMELAWAQGKTVAEDRARQIELDRLHAVGRVAEVSGEAAVEWDTFARRARLDDLSRRAFAKLDRESQDWFSHFVDGVVEGLGDSTFPGKWEPWTPFGIFQVHHVLFGTFPSKLWRAAMVSRLGSGGLAAFGRETEGASGSNAWVVDGSRTASGKPLIAGDPHRLFETPGCYQQVRLTCEEFDVTGFTFPGVPGVQHFAHAGSVAWAITNAMADYQDLYLEDLERTPSGVVAQGPGGPEPVEVSTERIEVRGGGVIDVEVVTTQRGPVILGDVDDDPISLATAAWALGDLGLSAILPLLRSRTADDVDRAMDLWVEPVNNALIADESGQVRYRIAGRVPIRGAEARYTPVAASDPAVQWTGWIDPPREEPQNGQLVTANERRGPDSDRVGLEFGSPARRRRIEALLGGATGLTRDDFARIQADVAISPDSQLRELIQGFEVPEASELQQQLATWDGRFSAGSSGAAIFAAVRAELLDVLGAAPVFAEIDGPPLGLFAPWWDVRSRISYVLDRWVRFGLPFGLDAMTAVVEAWRRVALDPPSTWGASHRWCPEGLAPVELPGDSDCVFSTSAIPGTDRVARGPVARYVWDLADRDHSAWIVPLGAAGDPSDPHFSDQLEYWLSGRLIRVVGQTPSSRTT